MKRVARRALAIVIIVAPWSGTLLWLIADWESWRKEPARGAAGVIVLSGIATALALAVLWFD